MGILISFVGASGSGKSSLLNYLEGYGINCKELSARPFLDNTKGSYDEQMTDLVQTRIMINNMDMTQRYLREVDKFDRKIAVSRSPIDVLAYSRVLNHGLGYEILQENFIKYICNIPNYYLFYTVPDFPLTQTDDKLRGMNEEVRQKTDKEIQKIFFEYMIHPSLILKGSFENRCQLIDNFLKDKI